MSIASNIAKVRNLILPTRPMNLHHTEKAKFRQMGDLAQAAQERARMERIGVDSVTYIEQTLNERYAAAVEDVIRWLCSDAPMTDELKAVLGTVPSGTGVSCGQAGCDSDMTEMMCPNDRTSCLDHCGEDHTL